MGRAVYGNASACKPLKCMQACALGQAGQWAVGLRRMNWVSSRRLAKRNVCAMVLGLGCLAMAKPASAEPRINEFLAVNNRGLAKGDGDISDWIEIYNSGAKTIRLNGWALTDDAESPSKWLFPNVSLGARQYLVVFASGENRTSGKDLHTNFKLNGNGEYLALVKPDGSKAVSEFTPSYPAQHEGISYGVGTAGQQQFFDKPTPGKANGSGFAGFVHDTKFDTDRGFYDAPFEVRISCTTMDAKIRYTVDGSKPTPKHGIIYRRPIPITTTTTLRAMAYRSGLRESNVDTHTYLFAKDIIRQPARPKGFPSTWNGHPADYEMDPEVVNHLTYKGRVASALKAIPSLSLVLNQDDFFKTGQGIYPRGENVEKATSVELIYPDTGNSTQADGSVQIVGGSSTGRWKVDKLSMRLKFTSQYGDASFRHPLFGDGTMNRFDTLVVDARLNQVWSYGGGASPSDQRRRGQNVRDQFVADLQNQMGGHAPHGIHVHVYINGLYWGLHTLHERPDEHFAAHYLGGNKEDYDVIKHRKTTVVSGNSRSYNALISATSKNLSSASAYAAVGQQLDIPNFIDYMLVNFFVGNGDWSHQNWYASFNRDSNEGRWRFHSWDAEHVLKGINDNSVTKNNAASPTGFHQKLKQNAEYNILFGDRIHQHFFSNGVLTPERAAAAYKARLDSIDEAIVAESARWGDNQRVTPYTRDKEWVAEKNRLLKDYFPKRTGIVLNQLRSQKLYPSIAAPTLSQHGGTVPSTFQLTLKAAKGQIFFTLDGSDPRLSGGALSNTASRYNGPIPIEGRTQLKSRVRHQAKWSALVEAAFVVEGALENLRITEVMYHPTPGQSEFIELQNTGTTTLDLSGVQFAEGIRFTFPTGFQLDPASFVVLAENAETFNKQFPGLTLGGVYNGRLSNGSEQITLINSLSMPFLSLTYSDQPPWPSVADGRGFSLVPRLANPNANPKDPENWRSSGSVGGSPGRNDLPADIKPAWITEVLAHTDPPALDSIELHNPNSTAIDLSHWFLTDDRSQPEKYAIPKGTLIPPDSYLVFSEEHFNPDNSGFALDSHGDQVYLFSARADGTLTGFSDGFSFGASENGVTFGRYETTQGQPQYPYQSKPTLGLPNAGPKVGPIVINEIHYHPEDSNGPEFVELKNITQYHVTLYDQQHPHNTWRVGGIDFQFPVASSIPPGGLLIVANVSPSEFETYFAVPDGVPIFGPFPGTLQDGGERLELSKPDEPDTGPDGSEILPYIVVDAVRYDDTAPWPTEPNGKGSSLEKMESEQFGNDANQWRSSPGVPSPGVDNRGNRPPQAIAGVDQLIETDTLPVVIQLSGLVKDDANPDFPAVSTEWTLPKSKTSVVFTNQRQLQSVALLYGLGKHTFELKADDGQYSVSDQLTVQIRRSPMEQNLIADGSVWRYLDDGSNQGIKWRARLFNDNKWKTGAAQLGYGDGDENTKVDFGGNGGNKHVTTYFRHAFEISNPIGVTSLEAALMRDDGAVAYLNGREIHRSNLPQGNVRHDTFASLTVGGNEESAFHPFTFDPTLLVEGKNVIAVEVHQTSRTSSDISFDFKLRGTASGENQPPKIVSFSEQTVAWPSAIRLEVQVTDDALPLNPGRLTMRWELKSGPGTVTLIDDQHGGMAPMRAGHTRRHRGATSALFSQPGTYVLIFVADDGQSQTMEECVIHAKGDSFGSWQQAHFTTEELAREQVSGPDADPDNDGMRNHAEYIAGTRPKDARSRLAIESIQADVPGKTLTVQFHTAPNRRYRLQRSKTALGPWETAGERLAPPNGGQTAIVVPLGQTLGQAQFFRLEIPAD